MSRWLVNDWAPGYTPENEPMEFEEREDAQQALIELVGYAWDFECEAATDDELEAINRRYSLGHREARDGANYVHVPGPTNTHLGRMFGIERYDDEQ